MWWDQGHKICCFEARAATPAAGLGWTKKQTHTHKTKVPRKDIQDGLPHTLMDDGNESEEKEMNGPEALRQHLMYRLLERLIEFLLMLKT